MTALGRCLSLDYVEKPSKNAAIQHFPECRAMSSVWLPHCFGTQTFIPRVLTAVMSRTCQVPVGEPPRPTPQPHTHSGEDHQFTMSKRNRRHGVGYQTTERVFQTQEHRVSFQLQLSCLDHLHTFAGQVCQPQESLYLFL